MDNLTARIGQLLSPLVKGFSRAMKSDRGEVVIPFLDSVEETQRPAVTQFITNTGAKSEDIAGYKSFDEFLSGYKPKAATPDWTSSLEPEHKTLLSIKGWKTPVDVVKSYSELEKLLSHDRIPLPRKNQDGSWEKGELERVMGALGLPKDPKDYKTSVNFKLPEGVALNEKTFEDFKAEAHKQGFLPHQYAFVMDKLAGILHQGIEAKKQADTKAFNEAALALRGKWGLAYDEKTKMANNILRNFATDPKQADTLAQRYANDPVLIELLANVGGNLSEEALTRTNMSGVLLDPTAAQMEINKIRAERGKELTDNSHPQHQYWVDKLSELYRMLG